MHDSSSSRVFVRHIAAEVRGASDGERMFWNSKYVGRELVRTRRGLFVVLSKERHQLLGTEYRSGLYALRSYGFGDTGEQFPICDAGGRLN